MGVIYREGYLAKLREDIERLERSLSPESVAMARELTQRLAASRKPIASGTDEHR